MILRFLQSIFPAAFRRQGAVTLTIAIDLDREADRGLMSVRNAEGRLVGGPFLAQAAARLAGAYTVTGFVTPAEDPGGADAVGSCGALILQRDGAAAALGDAPRIHSGAQAGRGRPSDIRIGEMSMTTLLNLIPGHPRTLARPVAVVIGTDYANADREDDRWERERERDRERERERAREREREREARERDREHDGVRQQEATPTAAPEPAKTEAHDSARWWAAGVAVGVAAAVIAETRDAEAAAALTKAEVTMLPDGDAKPPPLDAAMPAAEPAAAAPDPAPAGDWAPSGGGYDR